MRRPRSRAIVKREILSQVNGEVALRLDVTHKEIFHRFINLQKTQSYADVFACSLMAQTKRMFKLFLASQRLRLKFMGGIKKAPLSNIN